MEHKNYSVIFVKGSDKAIIFSRRPCDMDRAYTFDRAFRMIKSVDHKVFIMPDKAGAMRLAEKYSFVNS